MTPQALGGLAVKNRTPPKRCLRCGADFRRKTYHQYLGHMGLHGYADRYFCGDISKAARRLARNGLASQDPFPWNGAFKRKPATIFKPKGPKMKTDFSQIKFDADEHRYFLNGKELRSVTNLLKDYQKPFDRDGIAQRVANRESRSTAEVLAEWDAKGERARVIGTAVHAHIEKVLRGESDGQLSLDPFLGFNIKLPEIIAFDRLWCDLAPTVSYLKDHIEWVIGDESLGLAGTVDTVLFSPQTGKYHIWDWKTGKFDLNNRYENLLHPFSNTEASKLNIYSLQTSLYRLIIERNTGLDFGDSYLVHLSEQGAQIHRAVDFREILFNHLDRENVPF